MRDPWNISTFGGGALDWSPNVDWQADALCRQVGSSLFFAEEKGETGAGRMAKSVCNGDGTTDPCPVRDACISWALEINDQFAILGGTSPRQRQRLRIQQKRDTGGRVRCRTCRRNFTASAGQLDCSEDCRYQQRRRRDQRRDRSA
jgi:WhiB family transcriptional regulator, redox-sensing transcriptional regulator